MAFQYYRCSVIPVMLLGCSIDVPAMFRGYSGHGIPAMFPECYSGGRTMFQWCSSVVHVVFSGVLVVVFQY